MGQAVDRSTTCQTLLSRQKNSQPHYDDAPLRCRGSFCISCTAEHLQRCRRDRQYQQQHQRQWRPCWIHRMTCSGLELQLQTVLPQPSRLVWSQLQVEWSLSLHLVWERSLNWMCCWEPFRHRPLILLGRLAKTQYHRRLIDRSRRRENCSWTDSPLGPKEAIHYRNSTWILQ